MALATLPLAISIEGSYQRDLQEIKLYDEALKVV
jgi:hypothetical protein